MTEEPPRPAISDHRCTICGSPRAFFGVTPTNLASIPPTSPAWNWPREIAATQWFCRAHRPQPATEASP
jgi:hypothetical protein